MALRVVAGLAGAAIFATLAFATTSPEAPGMHYIADEISVDGPALFYAVDDDTRRELWSVHCVQPLRGCLARAPGLVLRLDDQGRPWLIAVAEPQARVLLRARGRTRPAPGLLTAPLSPKSRAELSVRDAEVIIEQSGAERLRTPTTGLDRVVDYLVWINGNTARTLRDARLWPRNGDIRIQDMSPEVLERYDVMQRRALEAQRRRGPVPASRTVFTTAEAAPG